MQTLRRAQSAVQRNHVRGSSRTEAARSLPLPAQPFALADQVRVDPDIAFLGRHGVTQRILADATRLAEVNGTIARQELFGAGFDRQRFWKALATDLGVTFTATLAGARLASDLHLSDQIIGNARSVKVDIGGRAQLIIAPDRSDLTILRKRLRTTPELGDRISIASPEAIRVFLAKELHERLGECATRRLQSRLPSLSSHEPPFKQTKGPMLLLAALCGLFVLAPQATFYAVGLLTSLFFINCCMWKMGAALCRTRPFRLEPLPNRRLPTYTVLVPLYREANVVADLVRQLSALDYPALCINSTKRRESRSATIPQWQTLTSSPA